MKLSCKLGWVPSTVIFIGGFCLGAVCFSVGGRSETAVKTSTSKKEDVKPPQPESGQSSRRTAPTRTNAAPKRKEINGIPYDVFFDDPLKIASDTREHSFRTPLPSESAAIDKPTPSPTQPAATDGPDWALIIPQPALEAEVKRIRNRLTQYLQSVGNYNQNIFQIPADAATLAMLAGIASVHPGEVRWKANAKFIRDLASKMLENELAQGRKSFETVESPFLSIVDILNGSPPANLPDAEDRVPFADVADFGLLMKRLERAEKWAKSNAGSEESFKQNGELAKSEAYLSAAIANVITLEGYGFADDDEFKNYASPMSQAALKMAGAVQSENFAQFDEGMNSVSQMCTQCHGSYRD